MENSKISIIVPIYNCKQYLPRCVDSLLGQTYPNLEIILVNDGSEDGVEELLRGYEKDGRIIVINQENRGVSSARNTGLDRATGEYIGFLDADDFVDSEMYSTLLCAAEERGADIVQCGVVSIDTNGGEKTTSCPPREIIIDKPEKQSGELFRYYGYGCCSKLYKRELIGDIRFDTRFPIGEDLMFNLGTLASARRTVLLPTAMYYYTQREDSATHTAFSGERLLSFRNMLKAAEEKTPSLIGYIRNCQLNNNTDIISKIILAKADQHNEIVGEIRKECRKNSLFILFCSALPIGQKMKLLGIGFFFGIYSRSLRQKKGGCGQ